MSNNDMRKYIDIVEARRVGDPDVSYKDEKDTVTAKVSGKTSVQITKISNTYMKIRELEKQIKSEKDSLTPELKSVVNDLFDAEDAFKTKYVETVSNIVTIAKDIKDSEKTEFDYQGFFDEASQMLEDNVLKVLMDLKEKYTNIKKVSGRSGSLRDVKVKESLSSGFLGNLKNWASDYKNKIIKKIPILDKRFEILKRKYNVDKILDS